MTEKHTHRCMRCKQEFSCQTPEVCVAKYDVLPRVVLVDGSVVDHCEWRPTQRFAAGSVPLSGERLAHARDFVAKGITFDERPEMQGPLIRQLWELLQGVVGGAVPEGPWVTARTGYMDVFLVVIPGTGRGHAFNSEREANAVRDALNRLEAEK